MNRAQAYSPEDPKPLGGYAILLMVFQLMVALIGAILMRSRKRLPEQIPTQDLALMSVATFKLSRLITKDKVTAAVRAPFTRYQEDAGPAEVSEEARGTGLHRAVGELLACPYCIGQWIATVLLAAYVWQPRLARTVASLFAVVTAADYLQQAWVAVDKAA
jgi:Protein of unknown function (DUF1360)